LLETFWTQKSIRKMTGFETLPECHRACRSN